MSEFGSEQVVSIWEELEGLDGTIASKKKLFEGWEGVVVNYGAEGVRGFSLFSPSRRVRVTSLNLGMKGRLKTCKYHIDLARKDGHFDAETSTVVMTNSLDEALHLALTAEKTAVENAILSKHK